VQVGDPFTEKRLLEACLELMATGAVISIQDMGAAGLTCSAVEMGDKGGLGIQLTLDHVPQREDAMTAYEMMLSESQERMLMVLRPEKEAEARAVFEKWDLDFAIVGETIPEDRFVIVHGNETVADLPLSKLSSEAPEYDRPWVESPPAPEMAPVPEVDPIDALKALIASPNYCSRAWIYEQYDYTVMADTIRTPGAGAGIVRVHGTDKALAFTSDVTPRYVRANPVEGGKQAVAEAFRNLCAVGAKPLATTDNLNFGNPEKPEIMGQFVGAIKGHRRGVHRARHADRVGQCQPLQRDRRTGDPAHAHHRRGGSAGQPRSDDRRHDPRRARPAAGGRDGGPSGPIRAAVGGLQPRGRRRAACGPRWPSGATAISSARTPKWINACTDLSDGGLALAAFEMAVAGDVGITLEAADTPTLSARTRAAT
jgi:phosphoribosylformylglycinamidine (FGAM) synthase-like enzyme